MAKFCSSCGKSLDDDAQFCDGCGAAQQSFSQNAGTTDESASFAAEDIEKNKVVAALSYILFFLPLIICPNSHFGRYHANQGLLLLIASVAGAIILSILSAILALISTYLLFISTLLYIVYYIGLTVLVIMGIVNAINGKAKPLPLIGNLFTIIK